MHFSDDRSMVWRAEQSNYILTEGRKLQPQETVIMSLQAADASSFMKNVV